MDLIKIREVEECLEVKGEALVIFLVWENLMFKYMEWIKKLRLDLSM